MNIILTIRARSLGDFLMESGDRVVIVTDRSEYPEIAFSTFILVLSLTGTVMMFENTESTTGLMAAGLENLKFFTVLSNIFCGIVAAVRIVFFIFSKKFPVITKMMSASAVGLTFLIIAAFLQPLYPDLNLYEGGNLYFHLIVPLLAMAEFIIFRAKEKIPFRYTFYCAALSLAYGIFYLGNILINGIGTWPETNDWYGFLNWGFPVGIAIFAFVVLMDFGIACLLRFLNNLIHRKVYSH